MRLGLIALIVVIVAAGCSDDGGDTTEASQFPTGSVRSWFDALEVDDPTAALELTYDQSMVVIIAVENEMDTEEVSSFLRRGVTDESATRYLGDFAGALRDRYGSSLNDVTVDGYSQIGETYAAVAVTGDGPATIMTRRAPGGLWQVDLVGTLGPALVGQIRTLLESAGEDEDGNTIREAFESEILPSLDAAAASDPENFGLASEIRVMKSELGL